MQNAEPKRRCSILKKRRSRSLSPKPLSEANPRRSRRISFSGKNAVREFFIGSENKETIWVASYEESTENQFFSHQSMASSTMHTTKNETVSMDMDCSIINPPKQSHIPRPSVAYNNPPANVQPAQSIDVPLATKPSGPGQLNIFKKINTANKSNLPVLSIFKTVVNDMEMSPISSKSHRATITQPHDMSMDGAWGGKVDEHPEVLTTKSVQRNTVFDVKDMTMDQSNTGSIEWKSNHHSTDMSILMSNKHRETVITKSPSKKPPKVLEQTAFFGSDMELTTGIINNADISIHPLHITRLIQPKNVEIQKTGNATVLGDMEMDESISKNQSFQPTPSQSTIRRGTIFGESSPLDISAIWSQTITANQNPIVSDIDKENDPKAIELIVKANEMHLDNTLDNLQLTNEVKFAEPRPIRKTTYEQNSLEMSDILDDHMPLKPFDLNKVSTNLPQRKGSIEFNETIEMDETLKPEKQMSPPKIIPKNRQTIYVNQSLEMSGFSNGSDAPPAMNKTPFPTRKGSIEFNASIDLDNTLKSNESMGPPIVNVVAKKRQTTFANQSIEMSDSSMDNTSAVPAKKFNLNKTPFYFKQNELDSSEGGASNSSILTMDNSLQNEDQIPKMGSNLKRQTEIMHDSIDEESEPMAQPIEISDSSSMNISVEPPPPPVNKRTTCYQPLPMVEDAVPRRNFLNIFNKVQPPIEINDSIVETKSEVLKKRGTIFNHESMSLENSMSADNVKMDSCYYVTMNLSDSDLPSNEKSAVADLPEEPSKLSFYEGDSGDDDNDDQLCNTKFDLVMSLEDSDASNDIPRRRSTMARSIEGGILQVDFLRGDNSTKDITITESVPAFPTELLKLDEQDVFKRKDLLRRSGMYNMDEIPALNATSEAAGTSQVVETAESPKRSLVVDDQQPSTSKQSPTFKRPASIKPIVDNEQPSTSKQSPTFKRPASVTSEPIQRPSIIHRSMTNECPNLDETSFLMNVTADKPARECQIDLSGYNKFEGLATVSDVLRNFQIRRAETERQMDRWKYQLENDLPLDGIDEEIDETESQNVEAPSMVFLWQNKYKCEVEQIKSEVQQMNEERLPGAFLPVTPDISILVFNKCKQLKNWKFEPIWYFKGNIHLRNTSLPAFKLIILYDPDVAAIDRSIYMHGQLKFDRIIYQFCPNFRAVPLPSLHLKMHEIKSNLPTNLLLMCNGSNELSALDDQLDDLCQKAIAKVNKLELICKRNQALLKMENGVVYIHKTMIDTVNRRFQQYVIEIHGIDTTGSDDVRTKPRRLLNDDVRALPKGLPFIEQFLSNDKAYVPMG